MSEPDERFRSRRSDGCITLIRVTESESKTTGETMKLQSRVALIVGGATVAAILSVNLLLATSLRDKDRAEAEQIAVSTGMMIRDSVLSVMISTGDYQLVTAVMEAIKKEKVVSFRMIRNEHLHRQFGEEIDKRPVDEAEKRGLSPGEIVTVAEGDDTIRTVFPFVTDERCGRCHLGIDDAPVAPGVVNGAAVITFHFTELIDASRTVTGRIMLLLTAVMAVFGAVILGLANSHIVRPMKRIATAVTRLRDEQFDVSLPDCSTTEICIVVDEVRHTARELSRRKDEREAELSRQREVNAEVMELIRDRAATFGVTDTADVESLMRGFTTVVDAAERAKLAKTARDYLIAGDDTMVIPSDPSLIQAVSVHASDLLSAAAPGLRARSVELALDEALANAIYHGNLELDSTIKDDDFDRFLALAEERRRQSPYAGRLVRVEIRYDKNAGIIAVTDEGKGFDWRTRMNDIEAEAELAHGRGILIMRTLAARLGYNAAGNRVEMIFDFARNGEDRI